MTINGSKLCIAILAMATTVVFSQDVDLVEGDFEGEFLCELTMDDVTGIMSRPTVVEPAPEFIADIIGPKLYYHDAGFVVWFRAGEGGEEQILSLRGHLARTWDEDNSEWYEQYSGQLTPPVSGEWRKDQTLQELADYDPVEMSPDEQQEQFEDLGLDRETRETLFDVVQFQRAEHLVRIFHEPITRFAEQFVVSCVSASENQPD